MISGYSRWVGSIHDKMKLRLKLHWWCRFVFHSQNKLSFRSPELAMVEMKLPKYIGPHFRHNYTASKNVRERGGDSRDIFFAKLKKILGLNFYMSTMSSIIWKKVQFEEATPQIQKKNQSAINWKKIHYLDIFETERQIFKSISYLVFICCMEKDQK